MRTFNLLFRRDSFIRRAGATETFLERALEEGRRYERQVAQDLSRVVFERAFPSLAQAAGRRGRPATSRRSARRRWSSSTGCCSCSTPRTGAYCP